MPDLAGQRAAEVELRLNGGFRTLSRPNALVRLRGWYNSFLARIG
jgi:hypothetical protein